MEFITPWKSWPSWRSRPLSTVLLGCILLLGSCGPTVVADKAVPTAVPAYTLLKVEPNAARSKVNIEVRLPGKLQEEALRQLALHLKTEHSGYAKTWIFYYLPGMKPDAGAWATTHFTPELEVRILGASQAQQLKQAAVPGKVLGRWYEEQYTQSALVLYQQGGMYHLRTHYKDGNSSDELLLRKGSTFTYTEAGSANGEYFKLLPDGNLGLLNREGKLFTQATPTRE